MTTTPADTVAALWRHLDDEAWDDAGRLLADDVEVRYPDSGRVLRSRAEFVAFNSGYPGRSRCEVRRCLAAGDLVAAEVRVRNDEVGDFWCAGFYTVRDGLVTGVDEYWVGPPD